MSWFPVHSPYSGENDGTWFGDPGIVMSALPGTVLRQLPRSGTWLQDATIAMAGLRSTALATLPVGIPTWPRLLDR
jgi:hypothetical protein